MVQIKAHLIHKRSHLDEDVCVWLRRRFGQDKYPGSETAEILFEGAATAELLGVSAEDLRAEGIESFGRWGGRFDEHGKPRMLDEPEKCATDLVAEDLGIAERPELFPILDFTNYADTKAQGHQLDMGCMVKTLHSAYPNDPLKVVEWALQGIEAKYQEELLRLRGVQIPTWKSTSDLMIELLGTNNDPVVLQHIYKLARSDNHPFGICCVAAAMMAVNPNNPAPTLDWVRIALQAVYQKQVSFLQAAEIVKNESWWEEVRCQGKLVSIVMARTDNEEFNSAARAEGAAIVIQYQSSGDMQIFPNNHCKRLGFRLNMQRITKAIRWAEQKAKGRIITTDEKVLEGEGFVEGAEEWYFTGTKGQMLLNGSTTADNIPTHLTDEQVIGIVKQNVEIERL